MTEIVSAHGNRENGYPKLNLDHVARFEPVPGKRAWDCYDAQGERLGRIGSYELPRRPVGVVPETTGTVLVAFHLWDEEVHVQRYPVVAWHVDEYGADPVICDGLPKVWCLEIDVAGDTSWIFPGELATDTFDKALSHAEECLRSIESRRERAAEARASEEAA